MHAGLRVLPMEGVHACGTRFVLLDHAKVMVKIVVVRQSNNMGTIVTELIWWPWT